MEDEGIAEELMDDNAMQSAPRPGTSLRAPATGVSAAVSGGTEGGRPRTGAVPRATTGFVRPGTQLNRGGTAARQGTAGGSIRQALQSRTGRAGTAARPLTNGGRFLRLGTASMTAAAGGTMFIDLERMDLRKYAERPLLSKALMDYILYVEHKYVISLSFSLSRSYPWWLYPHARSATTIYMDHGTVCSFCYNHELLLRFVSPFVPVSPRKAVELGSFVTQGEKFGDWWWLARLGKAYYQLGVFRDAERQFKASLSQRMMTETVLELGKVYQRLDQPRAAIDLYLDALASANLANSLHVHLSLGRIHDALGNTEEALASFKNALHTDASCIEAIASLGAHFFYADQPEIALRFYRRLLQTGVMSAALWNNLGLCCFSAGQYDMTLICYERALTSADDDESMDVWYNIGQLAMSIGDLGLAFQCFKIVMSLDNNHAEAYTNLGVLETRRGATEAAMSNFRAAMGVAPGLLAPVYNMALLMYRNGDYSEAYQMAQKAAGLDAGNPEVQELLRTIRTSFTAA